MVIQRMSDLVWIGQGILKIKKAQLRLACSKWEHFCNNSGMMQSIFHRFYQDDNMTETADSSIDQSEKCQQEVENESYDPISVKSNNITGTVNQKRDYSTSSLCRRKYSHRLFTSSSNLFQPYKQFHSHAILNYAITPEDLAKVATVAKNKTFDDIPKHKANVTGNEAYFKQQLSSRSRETRVPATRIGRVASFGGLAAGLMVGTVSELAKKTLGVVESGKIDKNSSDSLLKTSSLMSDANLERIVNTLCRVRGAALKLGQMLSIQDESIVDPRLLEVFERVRQSADFMPASQMKQVLVQELGKDWQDKLAHFEEKPFAAASIGQVHRAVLHDGREVAMKIQYPGVANSINSDINNLVTLLKVWNLFPEKFFIDKFISVAREELALECDYLREAEYSQKFRKLLSDDERYHVPEIIPELSTKQVITTTMISGVPLDQVANMDQDTRNFVASAMLNLLMREIFGFRMMQTDPNWSNFFYDPEKKKIHLLDFGASREYSDKFVDEYIEVVRAASLGDRNTVLEKSRNLKFLTGYESKVMEDAHIDAVMILGEPFAKDGEFDFTTQDTTRRIVSLVPTMMEHRLTAPPEESYSLHRKLSGGFLIASKLKSKFECKHIFDRLYDAYHDKKAKIVH
ncbi:atypical kinase COQ8B, mitochondrial-like [Styela clava]